MPEIAIVIVILVVLGGFVVFLATRKRALPEVPDDVVAPLPAAKPKSPKAATAKTAPAEPEAVAKAESPAEPPAGRASGAPVSLTSIDVEPADDDQPAVPPPAPPKRKRDVKGLRKGLKKVRSTGGLFGRLKELFSSKKELDPGIVEEMEEILLTSDVGAKTTAMLLDDIREALAQGELDDSDKVWAALRERAVELLSKRSGGGIRFHGHPTVVLMVGVNGTGKTTTIGKLATKMVQDGKKVMLVAGDTFRAAAVQQLTFWGTRVGCDVFHGEDDADPASVVFDAVQSASEAGHDYVLVDTAGRLHTKANLMDELKKVAKTAGKALDGAPHETLLVVDGTTGQNALQQTEMFGEALELTGIVLTKLDGTAKGGVILAIAAEHELAVRYVGVGERPDHLRDFDAEEFVEAMLGGDGDSAQAA